MHSHPPIPVALDQDLTQHLLRGLYAGAKANALKVVISTSGHFHIESKELRMILECTPSDSINCIHIQNEKQQSTITAEMLTEMRLTSLANDVVKILRDQYSPLFHSLADNIIVFSRTYGG